MFFFLKRRFLGKEVGLGGANNLEVARIDMVGDHCQDHMNSPFFKRKNLTCGKRNVSTFPLGAINIFFAKDKQEESDKFLKEKAPAFLANAERVLEKAGGKFFVANKVIHTYNINKPTEEAHGKTTMAKQTVDIKCFKTFMHKDYIQNFKVRFTELELICKIFSFPS